ARRRLADAQHILTVGVSSQRAGTAERIEHVFRPIREQANLSERRTDQRAAFNFLAVHNFSRQPPAAEKMTVQARVNVKTTITRKAIFFACLRKKSRLCRIGDRNSRHAGSLSRARK